VSAPHPNEAIITIQRSERIPTILRVVYPRRPWRKHRSRPRCGSSGLKLKLNAMPLRIDATEARAADRLEAMLA
jgi:hypothetical protein